MRIIFICLAQIKTANLRKISRLAVRCSRDEATRTPDPYVPNVVRYQLRYIPIFPSERHSPRRVIALLRVQSYSFFLN